MTTTDTAATRPSAFKIRLRESATATRMILKLDREKERSLYGQKWYDYRFISPLAATIRFRLVYQDVYRWKYSTEIDTSEAAKKTGVGRNETRAGVTSIMASTTIRR